jgi:hypothetical protein
MIPIQNAQLLAIEGRLTNTLDAFERRVRRWFSKEHSTAYLDTFKLPWDELLLHYYESNLANKSYNEVFDLAVDEYLPEFVEKAEEDDKAFADSLLKEQEAALKANKAKARQQKDIEAATQQMTDSAAIIKDKAQSISNKLDKKQANKPMPKSMSLKFDDDPEDI